MKSYLKKTIKLYFLLLFTLTFSNTILSPEFSLDKEASLLSIACSLFIYRFNIFSIFSLLFACLFTIQSYEKENVSVALSISGMHSFKIVRPLFFFALFLSVIGILINQFLLGPAIKTLNKDSYLSTYNKNLYIHNMDNKTLFYRPGYKHFTLIGKDKEILYAKSADRCDEGFDLHFVDHFIKKGGSYIKESSSKSLLLPFDHTAIKEPTQIKSSTSILDLIKIYAGKSFPNKILITIAYRIALPMLHIFTIGLASILGFSIYFRRKYLLSLSLLILASLFFFYLLECSAILAAGEIISPYIFITIASLLFIFAPYIAYAKKV